jgi:hypothetical protein
MGMFTPMNENTARLVAAEIDVTVGMPLFVMGVSCHPGIQVHVTPSRKLGDVRGMIELAEECFAFERDSPAGAICARLMANPCLCHFATSLAQIVEFVAATPESVRFTVLKSPAPSPAK